MDQRPDILSITNGSGDPLLSSQIPRVAQRADSKQAARGRGWIKGWNPCQKREKGVSLEEKDDKPPSSQKEETPVV
jgi:hypothetical protein